MPMTTAPMATTPRVAAVDVRSRLAASKPAKVGPAGTTQAAIATSTAESTAEM